MNGDEQSGLDRDLIDRSLALARRLQERAHQLQTPHERRQQAELDRMLQHPADKATLVQLTDQAFRSRAPRRSADQLTHILDVQGIPRFFSPLERTLLRGFQSFGGYLPGVAVPLVKEKMQHETANVVLPAEPELLESHLRARWREGVRMNVNFLGEALLGEAEAERRLCRYVDALEAPEVEVISVKVSTLYSQVSALAREHSLRVLCDRMERLYRAAARTCFRRSDGREVPKLVYLDMEEYRDMSITAETFMRTLDRSGLGSVSAGIALQAYLPDSFATQRRLTEWARLRVESGGAPVTLRIVKGANMEMERVHASLAGWEAAPFQTKRETDANFKRMLDYALEPHHARAVHVGLASHNLFEVAYGLTLARARGVEDCLQVEMLEGMANPQRRALREEAPELLLYAPACRHGEFLHAIGYLVRRLDENTGPDNFLRHAFQLSVGSAEWQSLERNHLASFDAIEALTDAPRRSQDRRRAPCAPPAAATRFVNEPDTDFSLPHNVDWASSIYAAWRDRHGDRGLFAPLVVGGSELCEGRAARESTDPSRPGVVVGRYAVATARDVEAAVDCARADPDGWRSRSAAERAAVLRGAAQAIRERRADLIGIALAEAGKVVAESDPEVSEAIDFCEFYARSAQTLCSLPGLAAEGRGVVAVVPPWNFPIAIPCGGVAAALAAGNTVILKPAPETVLTAWMLCECLWSAGVGRRTLQLVACDDASEATRLVTHAGVDSVVFTGGTDTAFHLLARRPAMHWLAETGGKNAMIVTAMADRDLAIQHGVRSAFGHAGQKCSATSLLILEREVYEDAGFRRTLFDAVESLPVGSAWEPRTAVGPLIRPPQGALAQALTSLEPGEAWAVEPRPDAENPQLWSPGVKWGVRPGSATHTTELFGPVLGVMPAEDLDEAIELVHRTGYGLTAGLQSLDDREQERWSARLRAGNLYINRGTTGAIVQRQPFGGMARSAIGPGLKAGGPSYVVSLMRLREARTPASDGRIRDPSLAAFLSALEARAGLARPEKARLRAACTSYERSLADEFGRDHDEQRLLGQDNLRRYLPIERMRIRAQPSDPSDSSHSGFELFAPVIAAWLLGCGVTISTPPGRQSPHVELLRELTAAWGDRIAFVEESDADLARVVREGRVDRVRFVHASRVPCEVAAAAAQSGVFLATAPVLAEGRIELLHYVREQSLCIDYHRYGNLGARTSEKRAPVH